MGGCCERQHQDGPRRLLLRHADQKKCSLARRPLTIKSTKLFSCCFGLKSQSDQFFDARR
jgi:hypothetical protein